MARRKLVRFPSENPSDKSSARPKTKSGKLRGTPKKIEKIHTVLPVLLKAVEAGMHREQAAVLAGISIRTFQRYIALDRQEDPVGVAIMDRVREAEAKLENRLVSQIQVFSSKNEDWRGIKEILTRRFRKRWGDKVELTFLEDPDFQKLFQVIADECGAEKTEKVLRKYIALRSPESTGEDQLSEA